VALGIQNIDCRQDGTPLGERGGRAGYLFNTGIAGIEQADGAILIGTNPRLEAPVLNARLRKRWLRGNFMVTVIGEKADLTYDYTYLGAGPDSLAKFMEHASVKLERPAMIIGQGALARADGAAILAMAMRAAQITGAVKEGWNGFNILHTAAGRVGALDVCALPGAEGGKSTREIIAAAGGGGLDALWLVGADEIDMQALGEAFVVYFGTHGDAGAHRADVILPCAAYTEKSATYVNTEGRPQLTRRAIFPPGEAREDWAVLRALSEHLGSTLPWNSLDELRAAMYRTALHLAHLDQVEAGDAGQLAELLQGGGRYEHAPLQSPIRDFYLTNAIARASRTMGECSALRQQRHLAAAE
jgi:NADH-quinone oxidoreductase subunit G